MFEVIRLWRSCTRSVSQLAVGQNLVDGLTILLCLFGMESRASNPQKQLCLTALYLLIWGEAANVRFLPECLCYIFHHVSYILVPRSDEFFLDFQFAWTGAWLF